MKWPKFLVKKYKRPEQVQKNFGEYPCNDYLNNVLRKLLKYETPDKDVISELTWCIFVAHGTIHDDVKTTMIKKGLQDYLYDTSHI